MCPMLSSYNNTYFYYILLYFDYIELTVAPPVQLKYFPPSCKPPGPRYPVGQPSGTGIKNTTHE